LDYKIDHSQSNFRGDVLAQIGMKEATMVEFFFVACKSDQRLFYRNLRRIVIVCLKCIAGKKAQHEWEGSLLSFGHEIESN
jgi:hypothetical protein